MFFPHTTNNIPQRPDITLLLKLIYENVYFMANENFKKLYN